MLVTYLRRELQRRMRQSIVTALGIALGIGLVIIVMAASDGVRNSQQKVLRALYGVGTDMIVTKAPAPGANDGYDFRVAAAGTSRKPGGAARFNRNGLAPTQLETISSSSLTAVSKLAGVAAAAGSLTLTDLEISGTIPQGSRGGGSTSGTGAAPAPLSTNSYIVAGVDLGASQVGPLSSGRLVSGRTFTSSDGTSNVAVVDSNYATRSKLGVGSTMAVGDKNGEGTTFKVIGVVTMPQSSSPPDVYIPLPRAQRLAGMKNEVNTIYVTAASASDINGLSKEIPAVAPGSKVTTSSDLANEVTGSLASVSSLANNLGRWLAIVVLAAAFLQASLMTAAAVSRRVREFGTLKAIGWRSRRIVGQVMGEAIVIGAIGGAVGVAFGYGGVTLLSRLAPTLSATVGRGPGSAGPGNAQPFGGRGGFRSPSGVAQTVAVHLRAPVTASMLALAVVLAIAGGVMAGSFGGWRAVRLRPAAALARVG